MCDRPTDRPTDGRTDIPSYRDARTHLKMWDKENVKKEEVRDACEKIELTASHVFCSKYQRQMRLFTGLSVNLKYSKFLSFSVDAACSSSRQSSSPSSIFLPSLQAARRYRSLSGFHMVSIYSSSLLRLIWNRLLSPFVISPFPFVSSSKLYSLVKRRSTVGWYWIKSTCLIHRRR